MNRRVRLANLLTGRGFIVTSMFTIFYQLLTEPRLFEVDPLVLVAILFFSQLGLFITLLGLQTARARTFKWLEGLAGGRFYWLHHRFDIGSMTLAGLLATLLAQSALNSLGHTESSDLLGALGGALVTHAALLPLIAIGLGVHRNLVQINAQIAKSWGQLELAIARDQGSNPKPIEPTFRAVAIRVVERLQAVKTRNAQDLNERIQEFIAQAVQPVVRDLVTRPGQSSAPRLTRLQPTGLLQLIRRIDGLDLGKAPEWALMPALLLLPFYLEFQGWLGGLSYFALIAVASYGAAIGLRLTERWLAEMPALSSRLIAAAWLAMPALVAVVLELTVFGGGQYNLILQLLGLLWSLQFAAGLFTALESDIGRLEAAELGLKHQVAWLVADINTREWFVRKLFTRNLPGLAKGELASQIFRLQDANQLSLTPSETDALVTQLEYRIKHLLALPPHATDIRYEVDSAIEAWRPKASIRYTMDFETAAKLEADPVATLALTEVIRELVGMSVHLAKASSVEASALLIGSAEVELTLTVQQDFLKANEHFDSAVLATATRFVREAAHHFDYRAERERAVIRVRVPIRVPAK